MNTTDYSSTTIVALAAIVARHLEQQGIDIILVGELAVEIYTRNLYLTQDIDMVDISYQKPAVLQAAMKTIGFVKQGRIFVNNSTDITVEFPSAPLMVGDSLIKETTKITHNNGDIPILLAIDVVKDRLAAYFHWKDNQSLVQALAIIQNHNIDANNIKDFCKNEGKEEEYGLIHKLSQSIKAQSCDSMNMIEKLVIKEILNKL